MATATLRTDSNKAPDRIGVGEVIRRTGWGTSRLMRLCMLGEIQVELLPGRAPRYSLEDIERVMRESK